MSMSKITYLVELEYPEGVPAKRMKEYIEEAVGHWKGQCHPADPLFDLDEDSVRCTLYPDKCLAGLKKFLGLLE